MFIDGEITNDNTKIANGSNNYFSKVAKAARLINKSIREYIPF